MEFTEGSIVWAKTDASYWPAIILPPSFILKKIKSNYVWVFWFGDYRLSEVRTKCIVQFDIWFTKYANTRSKKGKKWQGIYEALKCYGWPESENWNEEQLVEWAINKFNGKLYSPIKPVPEFVMVKLQYMLTMKENNILNTLRNDIKDVRDFTLHCVGCYSAKIVAEHPYIDGKMCLLCKEKIIKTVFLIGIDRIHYCCLICGDYGTLIVCNEVTCGRSYCCRCLDNFISVIEIEKIKNDVNWLCFLCNTTNNGKYNVIRIRNDWRKQLHILFNSKYDPIPEMSLKKRKIRVLSLFDGISSGLVALRKLNIDVDVYYASEIDYVAMDVTKKTFGNFVQYLGDITLINEEQLMKITPIDLLIGGSPCNELSLANPGRKGLYVWNIMKKINGANFFWIFENVTSMTVESKANISRFFNKPPAKINSVWFSPQNRERFFWGNCPSLQSNFEMDGPDLQEYLEPNRTAAYNKIQTVTTRMNSLRQGPVSAYPVIQENGNEDTFTIRELERIFGFDENYTDLPGVSNTTRQGLLGRAWSVQVACMILNFLRFFYLTDD